MGVKWDYVKFKTKIAFRFLKKKEYYLFFVFFFDCIAYWRHVEFPYVLKQIKGFGKTILDVSSAKPLALYLAQNNRVIAVDLWQEELDRWDKIVKKLDDEKITENLSFLKQDATDLDFYDGAFDVVYSISVIEHIDKKGDTKAMEEISRVLKPGGVAVITVPGNSKTYDMKLKQSHYFKKAKKKPIFYARWYDMRNIYERVITPSKMELINSDVYAERIPLALTFFAWMTKIKRKARFLAALNVFLYHAVGYFNFKKVKLGNQYKVDNACYCLTLRKTQ